MLEYGWPKLGPPLTGNLKQGLWEVRSTIKNGKVEARTYFGIDGAQMILLHGSDEKSDQDRDISLARERWNDYQKRKLAAVNKNAKSSKSGAVISKQREI